MAKSQLFEYAVLYHPRKTKDEENPKTVVIVQPTTILAENQNEVSIRVARELPAEYVDKINELEKQVRPF
jgi:hypothetical protein